MLEDSSAMDKKTCGRSSLPPCKSTTEARKPTDSSGSVRYQRRREASSSKNGSSETLRKAINPIKQGKYVDKRPRSRGQYYSSGKQEAKVEEFGADPEHVPAGTCSKKKQNLNHLLNFTLAPRAAVGSGSSSLKPKHGSTNWLATHKHKYNKEEFLQANCQFVVRSGVDYSPYLADPDLLVDWSYIEQIRLRSAELLACPICLDVPTAAKMTRCGHVYCWPCILHYLALSDKSWRKCPICYEAVHKRDLKSVVTISNALSCVDQEFTLKLMRRERGTLLAIPMDESDNIHHPGVPLGISETSLCVAFSKLLLADTADVKYVMQRERTQLERELKVAENEPEVCFIEQALELLAEREKDLHAGGNIDNVAPVDEPEAAPVERQVADADNVVVAADPFQQEDIEAHCVIEDDDDGLENVLPEDVETEAQVAGQKPFYFYQAADGQNVFLTALNLRMLELQFGSLAQAPLTISGTVLEKETGSMTRELRNRLRSLSHLPITAAFELVELDLKRVVSRDVLSAFAEPLQARAERRRHRAREERRRDRKITQQVEMQWGQRPGHRMRLDSARHFPKCGEDEIIAEEGTTSPVSLTCSNSHSSLGSSYPDISQPVHDTHQDSPPQDESAGPSFAQMLKVGAKQVGWGNRSGTWGRSSTSTAPASRVVVADREEEEYGAPLYQQSFGDAIARALDHADFTLGEAGRGKKKKRKQKVLFSSGMSFASK